MFYSNHLLFTLFELCESMPAMRANLRPAGPGSEGESLSLFTSILSMKPKGASRVLYNQYCIGDIVSSLMFIRILVCKSICRKVDIFFLVFMDNKSCIF